MANKTYNSVQVKIDFAAQVSDGTGRLPDKVLYSNISKNSSDVPSGVTLTDPHNLAITLAKIYTWAKDVFNFDPTGTNKITIKPGIDNDTTYTFATGTTAGAFSVTPSGGSATPVTIYKGLHAENTQIIKGSADDVIKLQWKNGSTWTDISTVTLGLLDSGGKIKDTYLPSYVDDVIEAYYDNGEFYTDPTTHTAATKITPESGKIYVDLVTNDSYRWGGSTYVKISNPTDVFTGATSSTPGTAGLVPAPGTADVAKFLCGNGQWADVSIADEKVKNTYGTSNTYYPAGMTQSSTTTTTQVADTAFKYIGTTGSTSAVGKAQLQLGNSTASGTAGNKQGSLVIYGSTAYAHTISGAPTAARTLTLPNKSGTLAVTDDLPTVNNGKLTLKSGSTSVTEFTANQSGDVSFAVDGTGNITVTPDASNHKVTISTTATKVESSSTNGNIKIDGTETTVYAHPTYTARTGKPTANVTVNFDSVTSFTMSQVSSDGTGHVSSMTDRTITFSLPSDIPRIPASGSRNNYYLRDDGTWADPMSEYNTLILNCTYDTSIA
jgi:hypothetical protein